MAFNLKSIHYLVSHWQKWTNLSTLTWDWTSALNRWVYRFYHKWVFFLILFVVKREWIGSFIYSSPLLFEFLGSPTNVGYICILNLNVNLWNISAKYYSWHSKFVINVCLCPKLHFFKKVYCNSLSYEHLHLWLTGREDFIVLTCHFNKGLFYLIFWFIVLAWLVNLA